MSSLQLESHSIIPPGQNHSQKTGKIPTVVEYEKGNKSC